MVVDFDNISQNISQRKYSVIGSGSGRLVFDMGNGYVVKMAKNKKGIAQNKAEYQIAAADHSDLFAKIVTVSEGYRYLVMEKAERIRSISVVWNYFNVHSNRELSQLELFNNILEKYDLLMSDLYRKTSWGIVSGRPVIIDYGFTRETRKLYKIF